LWSRQRITLHLARESLFADSTEFGDALAASGYPALIASTEYDDWPRGRIVYETLATRFVLYADRRLQTPEVIDALKTVFGLIKVEVIVRSDLHYR
jgi:hypothetical protein